MHTKVIDIVFDIVIKSFNITHNDDVIISITKNDIIDKNKNNHIVIARSFIIRQLLHYGFDINACAIIMKRTKASIRHLIQICDDSIKNNKLYNELYKSIDLECKELIKDTIEE